MSDAVRDHEAQDVVQSRLAELKALSYGDVARLPETRADEVTIQGRKCSLTTYVQKLPSGDLLATVQLARARLFGIGSMHTERGLVYSVRGGVREATSEEMRNSGG